jgi:hypothetical protein
MSSKFFLKLKKINKTFLDSKLKEFKEKYGITPYILDLNKLGTQDKVISNFFQKLYENKTGGKCKTTKTEVNTVTNKILPSPVKITKNYYSNKDNDLLNTSLPLFRKKEQKFGGIDIIHKRHRSARNSLIEHLEKLSSL